MAHGGSSVQMDMQQWAAAMQQYLDGTSRNVVSALNGKIRDLMFKGSQSVAVGQAKSAYRSAIGDDRAIRAVAVWRLRKRYGVLEKGAVDKRFKYIGSGKGYSKSAWIKAANKIPRTQDSAFGTVPMSAAKFRNSSASVQLATIHALASTAICEWGADGPQDKEGKQAIQETALSKAFATSQREMEDRMRQRAAELALKHTGRVL